MAHSTTTRPQTGDTDVKPVDVRRQLVNALRLDLVGPAKGSELGTEVLNQAPSRWYLTGFLVPLGAGEDQRVDETSNDEIDGAGDEAGGTDDASPPERPAARRAFLPSSMGVSLLVPPATKQLEVIVRWGDYRVDGLEETPKGDTGPVAGGNPATNSHSSTSRRMALEANPARGSRGGQGAAADTPPTAVHRPAQWQSRRPV